MKNKEGIFVQFVGKKFTIFGFVHSEYFWQRSLLNKDGAVDHFQVFTDCTCVIGIFITFFKLEGVSKRCK